MPGPVTVVSVPPPAPSYAAQLSWLAPSPFPSQPWPRRTRPSCCGRPAAGVGPVAVVPGHGYHDVGCWMLGLPGRLEDLLGRSGRFDSRRFGGGPHVAGGRRRRRGRGEEETPGEAGRADIMMYPPGCSACPNGSRIYSAVRAGSTPVGGGPTAYGASRMAGGGDRSEEEAPREAASTFRADGTLGQFLAWIAPFRRCPVDGWRPRR